MSIDVAMHDRRDGVEEGERVLAGERADRLGQRGRGEGAGRDDDAVPLRRRQAAISSRTISISGCAASAAVIAAEKPSRSTASAPPAGTWLASAARMTSEPSRRISSCSRPTALCLAIVGAERIGADQLGERRRSCARRSRAPAASRAAPPARRARDLPGGLGAGEPAADDMDHVCSIVAHASNYHYCQPIIDRLIRTRGGIERNRTAWHWPWQRRAGFSGAGKSAQAQVTKKSAAVSARLRSMMANCVAPPAALPLESKISAPVASL